jgi:hypothetical protein
LAEGEEEWRRLLPHLGRPSMARQALDNVDHSPRVRRVLSNYRI